MVDWKKDIKLSELLARGKGDGDDVEDTPFGQESIAPEEPEELRIDQGETEWELEASGDEEPEKRSFFTRGLSFGRAKDEDTSDVDLDSAAVEPGETTPFWKRELSFGRRKDDETPETFEQDEPQHTEDPADELQKTPFWKRELSFGRRKDDAPETFEQDEPQHTEDQADELQKTPFWKRELSFGRRKDDDAPETFEQDESPPTEDDADEPQKRPFWKRELRFGRDSEDTAPETVDQDDSQPTTDGADEVQKVPFWKRELRFGGRKDEAAPETPLGREEEPEPAAEAQFATDQPEKTPFWKREIGFGRRKDDAAPETFEQDEFDQPEAVAAADDFESDDAEKKPFWKRELRLGRGKEADDVEADVDAPDEEAEERTPFWKRDVSFGRRKEDEIAETPVHQPEFAEFVEPEPVAAVPDTETPAAVEDDEAPPLEPAIPAVPEPEPEPVSQDRDLAEEAEEPEVEAEDEEPVSVEPEPVAAAHADPEPVEEIPSTEEPSVASAVDELEEVPFWKREIKFGRRRGDADLAPPVAIPPPSDEAETVVGAGPDEDVGRKRFWKRQLTLGRPKEETFSELDLDVASDEEEKPFSTLRRRAKDPDFDAPKPDKSPFWKRELSFRRGEDSGRHVSAGRSTRGGRTKQVVGLKVGASQIAAARIVNNGSSPELVQLARQSIEQGIVVGGELRDPDALAEALRDFFTTHKLPNRNVRLGIGNNRIGVRSFEISGVHDPKQLENAVRFRAQEALPIPLDEAVLDYQVIDESASPTGIRTYRVLLVVAYRELIDRYVAACRGAGLRLVGIDLEAFALLRALSPPPAEGLPEDTALVAVSIGHDRSTFAVSNGTVCEFTRVLDWGGSSLNTAIARALDITPSQAEPVKRALSLSERDDGAPTPQNDEHTLRAEEAVRLELQTFARELVSSLHFYQNQPGSLAIGSITLTGGTAHLPGLAAELQRLIGVKVRVGDPLRRLKTGKRVETPAQVGSMAVAIGLGIED